MPGDVGPLGKHAADCIANGATASSVAAMAKAAVQQFGATTCPITRRLATVRGDRAEDACHKMFHARTPLFSGFCFESNI